MGQKLCHDPSHRTSYDGEKSEEIHTRTERHQNLLGIVALFSDESVTMDVDEQWVDVTVSHPPKILFVCPECGTDHIPAHERRDIFY
ncbi:hypothetical protein LptCag_0064 [Leptospirillum ferriphilum]|uniref:Uncharacterized protein n=1 Tax=Leptospirillum ferriphilum TaxID=178606 RepID=A0A094YJR5_9BACT|nr:hypothetical protein [Leptospirillum ferriphilum]KGA93451.1 hypothetical protein LptCag_0064 [Leptospirillum ferriphilum]